MSIDENGATISRDSLGAAEQFAIAEVAARDFPAHGLALRRNAEGTTWAVLTPHVAASRLLEFTFCRIEPNIVVQLVDGDGRRQFLSAASIDEALDFARAAAEQAALAAAGTAHERTLH